MHIGERIIGLRHKFDLTQKELAGKINLDPVILNRIEKGKRALRDYELAAIARIFGCSTDYLLGNYPQTKFSEDANVGINVMQIPVYGRIVAGSPQEAVEDILGYIHIPKKPNRDDYFALKVFGSSMEPTILDGDIVVVHRQPSVDSGQIAVVMIENADATVKRIFIDKQGLTLRADNPAVFPTVYYSTREVQTLPVVVLGCVVAMHRDF